MAHFSLVHSTFEHGFPFSPVQWLYLNPTLKQQALWHGLSDHAGYVILFIQTNKI